MNELNKGRDELNWTEQNISKLMYVFFNYDTYKRENQHNEVPWHKSFTKETTLSLINLLWSKIEWFWSPIVETFEPLSLSNIKNILQSRISSLLKNPKIDKKIKKDWNDIQVFDILSNWFQNKRLMSNEQSQLIQTLQQWFPDEPSLQSVDSNDCTSCTIFLKSDEAKSLLKQANSKGWKQELFNKYKGIMCPI